MQAIGTTDVHTRNCTKFTPKFGQSLAEIWQKEGSTESLVQILYQSLACSIGSRATTVHCAACSALKTLFCSRVWLLLLHPCGDTSCEAQFPCLLVDNDIVPLTLARFLFLSGTTCNEGSWGVFAPVLAHIYCIGRVQIPACTLGRSAVASLSGIPCALGPEIGCTHVGWG